jgi:hypothetical protein
VRAIALAAALVCVAAPGLGAELSDRLPRNESADFAVAAHRAVLEPSYRNRKLGWDFEGEKPNAHFYTWTIVPSWGQGVSFYSVDRRTGDVWAALGCGLIQSPEIAALQANFRRRFGITKGQVQRIERQGNPNTGCS